MNLNTWKESICELLEEIHNTKKDHAGNSETSNFDFTEVICGLYDDLNFELFISEISKIGITKDDLEKVVRFHRDLNSFTYRTNRVVDNKSLFEDTEWMRIASEAKTIINILDGCRF